MKAIHLLLLLMPLLAGCKNALDVYESKAAPAVTVATGTNGTTLSQRDLSPDLVLVTGAVQRIALPLLNSPSIVGDKATCIVLVAVGAIPAHPDCRKVALHYDSDGWWLQGIKAEAQLVLRFQKDGRFDGVQFPATFIQPSGAANRGQPVRSDTNRTSVAADPGR